MKETSLETVGRLMGHYPSRDARLREPVAIGGIEIPAGTPVVFYGRSTTYSGATKTTRYLCTFFLPGVHVNVMTDGRVAKVKTENNRHLGQSGRPVEIPSIS
jgi:hypothetical protein